MKTAASKANANRSSKRSHALKELLEKQETNLLEIKDNPPFEASTQTVNTKTIQFGGDIPVLPTESRSNLSEAIGIFHELINKEIGNAATLLEIEGQEFKAWIDLPVEVPAKTVLSLLRTMQY